MRKYRYRSRRYNKYIALVLVFVVFAYLFTLFEGRVRPIMETVAESQAQNLAIRTISDAVNKTMSETNITYSDLAVFQKNQDDNITAVVSNVVEVNRLKSALTSEIETIMNDLDRMTSEIPVGNLFGQSILSGAGPNVKITMVPVGYANIEIKNDFSAAGINQTKHVIYLEAKCNMSVLLPMSSKSTQVVTQIPIAETIIVGNVPNTYTNVTGQSDLNNAMLNVIPVK